MSTPSPGCPLERLPEDVVRLVFELLEHRDRLACTLVSRSFCSLARSLGAGPIQAVLHFSAAEQERNDTTLRLGLHAWRHAVHDLHVVLGTGDTHTLAPVLLALPCVCVLTLVLPAPHPTPFLHTFVKAMGGHLTELVLEVDGEGAGGVLGLGLLAACTGLVDLGVRAAQCEVAGLPVLGRLQHLALRCHTLDGLTLHSVSLAQALVRLTLQVADMRGLEAPDLSQCPRLLYAHLACNSTPGPPKGSSAGAPAAPLIAACTRLATLAVIGYRPFQLSGVQGLQGLVRLHLEQLPLHDWAPLALPGALSNLRALVLSQVPVTDLAFLAAHPALAELGLGHLGTAVLATLPSLPALVALRLSMCGWVTLAALPAMAPALQRLTLVLMCSLRDISALPALPALRTLALKACRRIGDFAPLGGCVGLQTLQCVLVDMPSVVPLAGLPVLRRLTLSGTPCVDLLPLAACPALRGASIVLHSSHHEAYASLATLRALPSATLVAPV